MDGFMKLLNEIGFDLESKETRVLIYFFKGLGLYFKK